LIESTEIVSKEEIEASIKMNEVWNAECSARREERLRQRDEEHEGIVAEALEKISTRKRLIQERVDDLVRMEKVT